MDKITNIIETLIKDDAILISANENRETGFIRAIVDSEQSLDAEATSKIAKVIRDSQELDKRYPKGFQLEVTTPGVTSPLLYPFQYKKNIGRKLSITLNESSEMKRISGELIRVNDEDIDVKDKKNNTFSIRFDDINKAVVKITFK